MVEPLPLAALLAPAGGSGGDEADRDGPAQLAFRQVLRYAYQVVTHIGVTGERVLQFQDARVAADEGTRTLEVDVANSGERWMRNFLSAELYDTAGTLVTTLSAPGRRIYPGTSVRYRIDLTDVAAGMYRAIVIADSGGDDVFGTAYTLDLSQ